MTFLTIEHVVKRYGDTFALNDICLSVEAGSRVAIVGASGSGKTTLLKLIAGFEIPDSGVLTLDGTVLASAKGAVPAHKRGIGFVAQDGALFPHLTVAQNIGFGLDRSQPNRLTQIKALMAMVELDPAMLERKPHQLSGGQQQRVSLARALARKPKLMLLDEPFSALDTTLRASTRKTISNLLREAGIATILVTHDQAEALSFADQVVLLNQGRLGQAGTPLSLYQCPKDRQIALFLGDAILLHGQAGNNHVDCPLGRIPAQTGGRAGAVELMLRPEQLSLLPDHETSSEGIPAEIIGTEFGGNLCTVTIKISATGEKFRITGANNSLFPIGSKVRVVIAGEAYVFDNLPCADFGA